MKAKVRAVPERGFRRAGMAFTRQETTVDVDEETIAILKAEPLLVVVEIPEPEGGDGTDLDKRTNAELAELLKGRGVEVPARANKQTLLDLLAAAEEKGGVGA